MACVEEQSCYPLVEIDAFLCELASTVCGVHKRLILHHLHALASLALLVAVFADHVQLPNPVLETKTTTQLQLQPEVVPKHKEVSQQTVKNRLQSRKMMTEPFKELVIGE